MKKALLFICVCIIGVMLTGCERQIEKDTGETLQSVVVDSNFIDIQEPEQTITVIDLPRSYDYKKEDCMPTVRNQGNSNTCWAYASLSALESSTEIDTALPYSVEHLLEHNPYAKKFQNGGSYVVAMSYLLSWRGPVSEMTYSNNESAQEEVHVQEIRQTEPKDYESIKRMIYLYGGVESSLYVDFDQYVIDSSYYNRKWNSYCYPGNNLSNHDILIIGWDDDYPAERFIANVSEDGAFLCQSSWGHEFGNDGTFYVSYEDVNIGNNGIVYSRIEQNDNYDRIFQSDLCGFTAQIGYKQDTAWFANVYKAEEDIAVRAVGFYATGKHTKYEIYKIPCFLSEESFAEKEYVCNGYLEDAGYYTIDLPNAFETCAGEDFAVVVKIITENAEYPVAVECPVEGLSENADLSDGRGYLSFQGKRWEYVEKTKNYNICLKAYGDLQ